MKATHTLQFKRLLTSTLLLSALTGCGQSGPLYLPEQEAEQNQPQDMAQPSKPDQISTQQMQE